MKYLIMCEGPNEKEIIDILVESGKFFVGEDELLGLTAYHARQIKKSAQVRTELNIYPGKVKVLRIGDKQRSISDAAGANMITAHHFTGTISEIIPICWWNVSENTKNITERTVRRNGIWKN